VTPVSTSSYTVHDPSGRVVFRGVEIVGMAWSEVGPRSSLTVEASLGIKDRIAHGVG